MASASAPSSVFRFIYNIFLCLFIRLDINLDYIFFAGFAFVISSIKSFFVFFFSIFLGFFSFFQFG